jgi:hypothetical protein
MNAIEIYEAQEKIATEKALESIFSAWENHRKETGVYPDILTEVQI